MREDMAKVLVERPRLGGGVGYPRHDASWQRTQPEDWPKRESIGRVHYSHCKYLNENLAPLRRFLRSHCGQPWDQVYSEICERINRDSAVQFHIWQHLMEFVCVRTTIGRDGGICDSKGEPIGGYRAEFYVHPLSGLLCHQPRTRKRYFWWRRELKGSDPTVVRIDDRQQYRRIDGIWYLVTLAPLPREAHTVWDAVHRKRGDRLTSDEILRVIGQPFYAASKRQIGKREIRQNRLNAGR